MTTDEKIQAIRYEKIIGQRIWKMFKWTAFIVLVISLFGALNQILYNESTIMEQNERLSDKLIEHINDTDKNGSTVTTEAHSIGEFTITHYAKDERCCGKTDGITATGTQATVGRTIAVDPEIIPLGSTVIIDGQEYIAEDVGGAVKGRTIDIFVGSYDEAVNRGKITREVFTN